MEFKIERKENENLHKYPTDDLKLAQKFSEHLEQELGKFLLGVIVFGSSVRREHTDKSDIDVLVITDDATFVINEAMVETYKIIVENLMAKISMKLHIT